jgi:hypothetical protein
VPHHGRDSPGLPTPSAGLHTLSFAAGQEFEASRSGANIRSPSRRRPGSIVPSLRNLEAMAMPYQWSCPGEMDPGLPHGSSPWAEGPRGDEKTCAREFLLSLFAKSACPRTAPSGEGELFDACQMDRHRTTIGSAALISGEHLGSQLGNLDDDVGRQVGSAGCDADRLGTWGLI